MSKILIVDDSKSMRQMIEMTLSDANHEVVSAEDGVDALAKSKQGGFDVVITDINMPNMDGIQLIGKLREQPEFETIPILCLTTESGNNMKSQGKAAGATGWLVKPFEPTKLLSALDRVLS